MKISRFCISCLVSIILVVGIMGFVVHRVWGTEKYPSKSIEMFCGFAPGGKTDLNTRILAKKLEQSLNITVVPGNKPGGGEVIAASALANAPPDGYTLAALGDASLITSFLLGRATYSKQDLRVIGEFNFDPVVLAVNAESPWKTVQEFIDHARKNPGLLYSHPGVGSSLHVRVEYFNKLANTKLKGVPFKGDPEGIAAVLGKHVQIGVFSFNAARLQADAGKMRILFCFDYPGQGPDPKLPNIPSFFGKDVFNMGPVVNYMVAPGRTPEGIAKILESTLEKITEDGEFIENHKKIYLGVRFIDGETVTQKIIPRKTLEIKQVLQETGLIK